MVVPPFEKTALGKELRGLKDEIVQLKTQIVKQNDRISIIDAVEGVKLWTKLQIAQCPVHIKKKEQDYGILFWLILVIYCLLSAKTPENASAKLKNWMQGVQVPIGVRDFFKVCSDSYVWQHRYQRNQSAHFSIPFDDEDWESTLTVIACAFAPFESTYTGLRQIYEDLEAFSRKLSSNKQ